MGKFKAEAAPQAETKTPITFGSWVTDGKHVGEVRRIDTSSRSDGVPMYGVRWEGSGNRDYLPATALTIVAKVETTDGGSLPATDGHGNGASEVENG